MNNSVSPRGATSRVRIVHFLQTRYFIAPHALRERPHGRGRSAGHRPRWAWSAVRRSHLLRRLSERSKCSESTCGHRACTAVARAAMPLGAQLVSACAIAQAVDRRYRPMNSERWQLIVDRWLLAHVLAAPSRSTRHRQGEWRRTARISGGRACVSRLSDRTTRYSAPLHAE